MIDINYVRENFEEASERLMIRGLASDECLKELLVVDDERKKLQKERDGVFAEVNSVSKEIGILFREGKHQEANIKKSKTTELKSKSKELDDNLKEVELKVRENLLMIPNLPDLRVPKGKEETDNETISQKGEIPDLAENRLTHWELAERYDIIDFELGTKITGAGFPVYKGKGAKLQRALINFFLDMASEAGYKEIQPPILVNEETGFGTGQLPDKEGQMYFAEKDNFYLIPTAEVPITNIYRGELLEEDQLPIKMAGYTPCFRREAGSYGKDVRGLNRLHQFDKVEIVHIEHPDRSYDTLEEMRTYVEGLIDKLGLPYRVLKLCGGDLGFASAFTYDMEVFSAGQEKWLEVSSVSNFESFQSNRMKLRFRSADKKEKKLLHTLNGSALAFPRILASILENNQTEKGILIPEMLKKYTGFSIID